MRRAILLAVALSSAFVARTDAEPTRARSWYLASLTTDGKHALLKELMQSHGESFRVVNVDTNQVEAELALPLYSAIPMESMNDSGTPNHTNIDVSAPELGAELVHAAAILAQFPLGASPRIAATPDGHHVAFNGGDWMYVAADGKVGARLASQASYQPWFSPDGKTLIFSRERGAMTDYALYATSVDGKAPLRQLAGTNGTKDKLGLTDHGSVRVIAATGAHDHTCVLDIGLAAPNRVTRKACFVDDEKLVECTLSPAGTWLACSSSKVGPDHQDIFHVRAMEEATGKLTTDFIGFGLPTAVRDDGHVVLFTADTFTVYDAHGHHGTLKGIDGVSAMFRSPTQLVAETRGGVVVVDVTTAR